MLRVSDNSVQICKHIRRWSALTNAWRYKVNYAGVSVIICESPATDGSIFTIFKLEMKQSCWNLNVSVHDVSGCFNGEQIYLEEYRKRLTPKLYLLLKMAVCGLYWVVLLTGKLFFNEQNSITTVPDCSYLSLDRSLSSFLPSCW